MEEPEKGAPLGIVTKTSSPPSQSPDLQAIYSLETREGVRSFSSIQFYEILYFVLWFVLWFVGVQI